MARSIRDWFSDHENSSMGDAPDDEVVEAQEPWDGRLYLPPAPRTGGSRARSSTGRRDGLLRARGKQSA